MVPAGVVSRTALSFVAYGDPIGQAAIAYSRSGHGYYANGKILKPWRAVVAAAGAKALEELTDPEQRIRYPLIKGIPVDLAVTFWVPRPKTVSRRYPTVPPDLQHFVRAAEDALTKVVWHDDSQIVHTDTWKLYVAPGGKPCATFCVRTLELS